MSEGRARPKVPTKSWLIRCWAEPREQDPDGDPVRRCSIRDLETGEERYISDPHELGNLMTRRIPEGGGAGKWDEEPE